MEIILQAKKLCKEFRSGNNTQHILKDVNVSIRKGEFVSVMGPSGSGKSTLLYTISGMDKATSGSVKFGGQELTTMSEEKLAALRLFEMGFIFQQSHLLKNLSIEDNILLPANKAGKLSPKQAEERVRQLMEKMRVSGIADHSIHEASGGQLQRVGICRALVNEPKILFGDEPTGALNMSATMEVLNLLMDIHDGGTTILLVTHDARVAARSERVLFILDGCIASELTMGRSDRNEQSCKERELILGDWLKEKGF